MVPVSACVMTLIGNFISKAVLLKTIGFVDDQLEKIYVLLDKRPKLSPEAFEEMAAEQHLNDCMLCGCCSYVCPSNIPLSQLFAMSKNQLNRLAAS